MLYKSNFVKLDILCQNELKFFDFITLLYELSQPFNIAQILKKHGHILSFEFWNIPKFAYQ